MGRKKGFFAKCKDKIDIDVKRFLELERAWIKCVSHSMNRKQDGLAHHEREILRDQLYDYLNERLASPKACPTETN